MSGRDQFDERAEALLPCEFADTDYPYGARLAALQECKEIAADIATICEEGAGEYQPGERCRQIERGIAALIEQAKPEREL